MSLALHLSIHFLLAISVGLLVGRFFRSWPVALTASILGGFLIDIDHVLEYIFFFHNFNISGFLSGQQFLLSQKNYLYFHAWEYLPLILFLAWAFRKKEKVFVSLLALACGVFVHLATDVAINRFSIKFYSITYRAEHNFLAQDILPAWQLEKDAKLRQELLGEDI